LRDEFGEVRKVTRNIADDRLRIDEDPPNNAPKTRFVAAVRRRGAGDSALR
jgi:hypothetical protein